MELPIDKLTDEEFQKVRAKLNRGILTDEALEEIEKLFAVTDPSVVGVNCDEFHHHEFSCMSYKSPIPCVVQRLVSEIRRYQNGIYKFEEYLKSLKSG